MSSAKMSNIYCKITLAPFMPPFQSDLPCSAAKDTSTMHAAVAPRNLDAAITMRFETSRRQPASLYAHGNTTWQHSCSHSTAICNQRFNKRIELRAYELNTDRGGKPIRANTSVAAPAAHTRYLSSPAGATLHGKTQGFVPKLPPKTKPLQHPWSHCSASCNLTSPTRISLRTLQHNVATFMQPFH